MANTNIASRQGPAIITLQQTIPTAPPAIGYIYVYVKSDGLLYSMNSNGSETLVSLSSKTAIDDLCNTVSLIVYELMSLGIPFRRPEIINLLNNINK